MRLKCNNCISIATTVKIKQKTLNEIKENAEKIRKKSERR